MSNSNIKKQLADVDAVFNALAHPARRQILMTIHFRGGEVSAGDIAARFAHTWATTSGHLRILEEAGLLQREKQGRTRLYKINIERLEVIDGWMSWLKKPATEKKISKAANQ